MITYSHHNGLGPTMVEPQSNQSPDRYLTPDDRDFMAVFSKQPGPSPSPSNRLAVRLQNGGCRTCREECE